MGRPKCWYCSTGIQLIFDFDHLAVISIPSPIRLNDRWAVIWKKFFRNSRTPLQGSEVGSKIFFRFFENLCGAFYLGSDFNSYRIEIFDQEREPRHVFIRKCPFGASFCLQADSVSHFSSRRYTFFSILFLSFCRGEKVRQHMWKSAWGLIIWLRGSRCTGKNDRFLL